MSEIKSRKRSETFSDKFSRIFHVNLSLALPLITDHALPAVVFLTLASLLQIASTTFAPFATLGLILGLFSELGKDVGFGIVSGLVIKSIDAIHNIRRKKPLDREALAAIETILDNPRAQETLGKFLHQTRSLEHTLKEVVRSENQVLRDNLLKELEHRRSIVIENREIIRQVVNLPRWPNNWEKGREEYRELLTKRAIRISQHVSSSKLLRSDRFVLYWILLCAVFGSAITSCLVSFLLSRQFNVDAGLPATTTPIVFPTSTMTNTQTQTPKPTSMPTASQTPVPSPTATSTLTPSLTSTYTPTPTPTFTVRPPPTQEVKDLQTDAEVFSDSVGDERFPFIPLIPAGQTVVVLDRQDCRAKINVSDNRADSNIWVELSTLGEACS